MSNSRLNEKHFVLGNIKVGKRFFKRAISLVLAVTLLMLTSIRGETIITIGDITYGTIGHYSVIVFEDFNADSANLEGALAVGGNARFGSSGQSFTIGSAYNQQVVGIYTNPNNYPTLVLGGDVSRDSGYVQVRGGDVVVRNSGYDAYIENVSVTHGRSNEAPEAPEVKEPDVPEIIQSEQVQADTQVDTIEETVTENENYDETANETTGEAVDVEENVTNDEVIVEETVVSEVKESESTYEAEVEPVQDTEPVNFKQQRIVYDNGAYKVELVTDGKAIKSSTNEGDISSLFDVVKDIIGKSEANLSKGDGFVGTDAEIKSWAIDLRGAENYENTNFNTDKKIAVFDIDAGQDYLPVTSVYLPEDIDSYDNIVFNIDSSKIEFSGGGIYVGDKQILKTDPLFEILSEKIIWNAPNAEQIDVKWCAVIGSLWAVNADVTGNGGSVNGMLIAKSLNQTGGFQVHRFLPDNFETLINIDVIDDGLKEPDEPEITMTPLESATPIITMTPLESSKPIITMTPLESATPETTATPDEPSTTATPDEPAATETAEPLATETVVPGGNDGNDGNDSSNETEIPATSEVPTVTEVSEPDKVITEDVTTDFDNDYTEYVFIDDELVPLGFVTEGDNGVVDLYEMDSMVFDEEYYDNLDQEELNNQQGNDDNSINGAAVSTKANPKTSSSQQTKNLAGIAAIVLICAVTANTLIGIKKKQK